MYVIRHLEYKKDGETEGKARKDSGESRKTKEKMYLKIKNCNYKSLKAVGKNEKNRRKKKKKEEIERRKRK